MQTLDDFTTSLFGPRGSERREQLERHLDISRRTDQYLNALFGWMLHVPIVGRLMYATWTAPFSHDMEGYVSFRPKEVLHKWGAVSFAFLNDGMKPTLWHTWQQLAHHDGDFAGIWVGGAPRNKADALRKRDEYAWDNDEDDAA